MAKCKNCGREIYRQNHVWLHTDNDRYICSYPEGHAEPEEESEDGE